VNKILILLLANFLRFLLNRTDFISKSVLWTPLLYLLTVAGILAVRSTAVLAKQDVEIKLASLLESKSWSRLPLLLCAYRCVAPHDQTVIISPDMEFERTIRGTTCYQVSHHSPESWINATSDGRGFIEILVKIELLNGNIILKKEYYCILIFHQVHCVVSSRPSTISWHARANVKQLKAMLKYAIESTSQQKSSGQNRTVEHLQHCFDYLRQAVMCSGDMAL